MAKHLKDLVPSGTKGNPLKVKKEDILNVEVEISYVSFTDGDSGTYAKVILQSPNDPTFKLLVIGAEDVVRKLAQINEMGEFPIVATFVKSGNAIILE